MMDDDDTGGCDFPGCPYNNGNDETEPDVEESEIVLPICSITNVPDDIEEIWFSILPSSDPISDAVDAYSDLVDPSDPSLDTFSLGVGAFQYISVNTGLRGWFQKNILHWGSDAYSEIYYDFKVSSIDQNGEVAVNLTEIVIENRFVEPINAVKIDYYLYDIGTNYPVGQYRDFIPVNITTNSSFSIPINQFIQKYPQSQYALLGISVWTTGFWGQANHYIQP